jgi:hypothetical protein
MVEPSVVMVETIAEVVIADELPPAPPAYIVVLPTRVVKVEPPVMTVEKRPEVVIADELPPALEGVTPGPV